MDFSGNIVEMVSTQEGLGGVVQKSFIVVWG